MDTPLKLTNYITNDNGSVEIEFDWDGSSHSMQYVSAERMINNGAEPIQTVEQAAKYILGYWKTKDPTGLDASEVLNKTLHVDPAATLADQAAYAPDPVFAWIR